MRSGRVRVSSAMPKQVTVESLTELWENTFLPNIRKELKSEIAELKLEIKNLNAKCSEIEKSQKFLSNEFDNLLQSLRSTKREIIDISTKVKDLEERTAALSDSNYDLNATLDDLQQYIRRDCVEVTGIPVLPVDSPKQLAAELGGLLGLDINDEHISIAHRLSPTKKNNKGRMIIKFVHRHTKDEFYKRRNMLVGKSTKDLPLIAQEYGKSIHSADKIFINESLTPYRKRLFGRINEYRRINKWKFIWTVNGKILLRESDSSRVFSFTTNEQFEDFKQQS